MGTDGSYTCDEPSITCKLVESLSCTPETNIMCQLYSIPTEKDLLPPTAPPPQIQNNIGQFGAKMYSCLYSSCFSGLTGFNIYI